MSNDSSDSLPPVDTSAEVTLREVTKDTLRNILELKVHPEQEKFVANNAVSIAQAHFEPKAWFRGVYAGETPVGFVMLYENPDEPMYYLWRFMIDARYQGMGFGKRAMDLVVERVRTLPNATELLLSYVPAEGGPEPFYARYGFVNTGKQHDDELEMKLAL